MVVLMLELVTIVNPSEYLAERIKAYAENSSRDSASPWYDVFSSSVPLSP